MDGDELIGHWGERYDVSADCATEGTCFDQLTARGDQLYALATAGADGSVLFAVDSLGIRETSEVRADRYAPPCSRCRFERWASDGERSSVVIGLPHFHYDNGRFAAPTLFDDPWEGGAWIVVHGYDPELPLRDIFEIYRVPL